VENLVAQLSRLPGVGTRTAHRLAFHLLQRPKDEALALAAAIEDVKERVRFCSECGNLTEEEVCAICRDARRDHTLICVVEQPVDLISVERTSEYRGLYHVLGGALSPLASSRNTCESTSCSGASSGTACRRSSSPRTRT
jgi:recombination protein RecR